MPKSNSPKVLFREFQPDMTYLRFGIKLKLLRRMVGLTQSQASQKIGMALRDYQRLESGQNEPKSGIQTKICERLIVGCKYVYFDSEDFTAEIPGELADKLFTRQGE